MKAGDKKSLTVTIRHSDGRKEEITLAEAIVLYEKRRDSAKDDVEKLHCQRRIEELQARWKKALRGGRVERAKTQTRVPVPASERPTKLRGRKPGPEDDTR